MGAITLLVTICIEEYCLEINSKSISERYLIEATQKYSIMHKLLVCVSVQTELVQKANSKEAYDNIVNEIYRLRDLRQETLSRNALRQDKRGRIAEMTDFLNTQTGDITEFDDKLVRKLVEKATVYDDRILVEFKSGLEIVVNL